MKTKAFLALLISFCVFLPSLAQTKPQAPAQAETKDDEDDVIKITTNLVQVDVVVTKNGKLVSDLSADDFEIFQDGKRQVITNFAYISNVSGVAESRVPAKNKVLIPPPPGPIKRDVPRRTVALVVDDLGLSFESINRVRQQLRKFIDEQLQPDDLVAVIRVSGQMGALQQFTTDRRLLSRAVDQLRWNSCSRMGIYLFAPATAQIQSPAGLNPCARNSVNNTMTALRFLVDAMGELPGRKAMVLFTDSLPRALVETPTLGDNPIKASDDPIVSETAFIYDHDYAQLYYHLAEMAIRSSVVIYSVDTQGLAPAGITAADRFSDGYRSIQNQMNTLITDRPRLMYERQEGGEILAKQTGGFQIRNSNSVSLDRIMQDQDGYYLLGYRPSTEIFDRRFHQIKAKVKRSGLTVRTRTGFFGLKEEDVSNMKRARRSSMNLAAASPFGVQDIEIGLASFFANSREDGSAIRSFLHMNPADLTFQQVDGRHDAVIHLYGVLFGDNGTIVDEVSRRVSLSLTPEGYEWVVRDGLRLRLDIGVKRPGSYQMRIAARDEASSRMGTVGQFVEIPDLNNQRLVMSGVVLRTLTEIPNDTDEVDNLTSPAKRRFSNDSELFFGSVIYNATLDPESKLPKLVVETKLYRDAKVIYSTPETIIDLANQPDLARIYASSRLQLNSKFEPGHYYLQVLITDKLAKKDSQVVQWVDFEIVPKSTQAGP